MAQERIDEFIELAKYYARAERELKVQQWVFVSIERSDSSCNYVRLFSYDLPREVYERRRWVIEWRRAKFVCLYPKGNVRCCTSFYDKRLGTDIRLNEDLRKLISAKAQVAKVQHKIDEYISYNKSCNLFFDENTDSELKKAREKLSMKMSAVYAAEERMKLKIKEIQEKTK